MIESIFEGQTAIIMATGPSLSTDQIRTIRVAQLRKKCKVFGMNHIWRDCPWIDEFLACNPEYFDAQWDEGLKETTARKWTWDKATAQKYGISYIGGRWGDGLSTDPRYIHYGHSSGFQLPGIAYHLGFKKMIFVGYDMCYAPDYDGRTQKIGSKPRHYFGEYKEPELQHWPSVKVKNGVFVELIEQFEKVKQINTDIEIINCTPNSAMTCFPMGELEDYL